MAYTDQSRRPSPASMTAVITIHALMGLALVTGLTVSGSIIKDKDITAIFIPKDIPKPPEPIPTAAPTEITPSSRPIVTPPPPIDLNRSNSDMDMTTKIPPTRPIEQQPGERAPLGPTPAATESPEPKGFDPVAAKPRNDPSRWLSNNDYRPSWARQELTGTARFRLEIAATGKVTGCTVTGSTGHKELDQATCSLVTRRAKFEPARGKQGEPVSGTYSGSVSWQLPE